MKKMIIAVATFVALTTATQALAQGRIYAIDGYGMNCALGNGAEGIIAVGNGTFSLTETRYDRQSSLTALDDGWMEADYAAMEEGMPGEPQRIRIRAVDDSVDIRLGNGQEFSGARCR